MKLNPHQSTLTPAQIEKIAIQAVKDAVRGVKKNSIISRAQQSQAERIRQIELKIGNMGYPREVNGVSFLVPVPNHFACSGGGRVLHWLAAMLAETGAAVATTAMCIYNPMLPVREKALPSDIAILSDGRRFNDVGASRVVWWILYFADVFFKNRIPKGEACFVYDKVFLPSAQAACDYTITERELFYLPHLDPQGCFPGRKTIEACIYGESAANKSSISHVPVEKGLNPVVFNSLPQPKVPLRALPVPAMVMPAKTDLFRDGQQHHEYAVHQRTLAMLRAARNFYTVDHHTAMDIEAAACGCRVWHVQKDGPPTERVISKARVESYFMNPARDVLAVDHFKRRILAFFGL